MPRPPFPYAACVTNRTLLIAVLLAVLSAAAAWMTRPDARPAVNTEPGPPAVRIAIDTASTTRVSIESAGLAASVSRNTGDTPDQPSAGWSLTLPTAHTSTDTATDTTTVNWPADPNAVRALLANLASLSIRPDAESDEQADDPDPIATIRIDTAAGPTTIRLLAPPLAGRVRVVVTSPRGSTTGTAPADRLRPASIEELASLAAPHPVRPEGVITAIDITAGDASLSIQRQAGLWSPTGTDARLDQPAVAALIDSLSAIRMAQIIVPFEPAPDDARNSTNSPTGITLRVTAQLPRSPGEPARTTQTVLRVLEQANIKGDANAVVTRTRSASLGQDAPPLACRFTLNAQTFPSLPASVDNLLDPKPLPWPAGETGSITITRPRAPSDTNSAASYTRTLQGWQANDADQPADRAAIERLLRRLADPHPAALLDEPDPAGDTPTLPALTLTLEPIGAAPAASIFIDFTGSAVLATQGRSRWTIDDTDGALRAILERLAPPSP